MVQCLLVKLSVEAKYQVFLGGELFVELANADTQSSR